MIDIIHFMEFMQVHVHNIISEVYSLFPWNMSPNNSHVMMVTRPLHWSILPFPTAPTCQVTGQNHRQRSLSTHLPFNKFWSPNEISNDFLKPHLQAHGIEGSNHFHILESGVSGVNDIHTFRKHQICGATSELSKISALSSIVPWGYSNENCIDVNSVN